MVAKISKKIQETMAKCCFQPFRVHAVYVYECRWYVAPQEFGSNCSAVQTFVTRFEALEIKFKRIQMFAIEFEMLPTKACTSSDLLLPEFILKEGSSPLLLRCFSDFS